MKFLNLLLLVSLAAPLATRADYDAAGVRLSGVGALDATDVAVDLDDDFDDVDDVVYEDDVVVDAPARRVVTTEPVYYAGPYYGRYDRGLVGNTARAVGDTVDAAASIPGAVLGGIFGR